MTLSTLDFENSGTIVYQGHAGFLIPTVEEPGGGGGAYRHFVTGYGVPRAEIFRVFGCWGFLKDIAVRNPLRQPSTSQRSLKRSGRMSKCCSRTPTASG